MLISIFMSHDNCLNCGSALEAGQNYCATCGQKADTHRISLHEMVHDAIHYFTHADKGIFHLVKALARRPGKVAQEYIAGRRKTYFKPFNFFLIMAGIVVFMTSTFYKEYPRPARPANAAARPMDPQLMKRYQAMGIRSARVTKFTGKYSNIINMVATPLFAAFFWLFYLRGRYSYLEHLVANMYFVPFIMIFYAFLVVPLQRLAPDSNTLTLLLSAFFLFEIIYRGMAYYQFMGRKGKLPLFKALGVSLLTSVTWIAVTYSLVWYYIRYGF